jgi:hypothetical protein
MIQTLSNNLHTLIPQDSPRILPPWKAYPWRLFSWWDMQQFFAENIFEASRILELLISNRSGLKGQPEVAIVGENKKKAIEHLEMCEDLFKKIDLPVTAAIVGTVIRNFTNKAQSYLWLTEQAEHIRP